MQMPAGSKAELAQLIINASLQLLKERQVFIDVKGTTGKPVSVNINTLMILHTTPFTAAADAPADYGLDIWEEENGRTTKVFSVWWHPLQVVKLKKGQWINSLM